jgi:PAS domain S-box-containing protein
MAPEPTTKVVSFEANAFLAEIVRSSDDAIITKDLNGVITSWNLGAEQMFGYTAQEAIGRSITIIIPSDRLAEESDILARLRRGDRIDHYETVRRHKDGTDRYISLTISPVRDEQGRIIGASKIARDITLRKQTERKLFEADRRKDEYLAMLSHELRNPLAPISNSVEVLRRLVGNQPELKSLMELMYRQVQHLNHLIEDLLDVSRISLGKIKLHQETINLGSIVSQAVEAAEPMREHLQHELTVIQLPEPVYVRADPTRLFQLLGNLLNNACKFTERGGHIWLKVEREDEQAVIRVRDTGIGLAADQLGRIFEMFIQVDASLDRSQNGLGIGLMLVKSLVEMHGGTVEAHSEGLGRGSEFVVRLPVFTERPKAKPQRDLGVRREMTGPIQCRILIVDDNRDSAESLTMLCKLNGHEVQSAYDGLEAIETAVKFRPNVILLDIGLPGLNGYEVARQIRSQLPDRDLTLVALTGWGREEDRRSAQEAGFDAHLVKPLDFDALERILNKSCTDPKAKLS